MDKAEYCHRVATPISAVVTAVNVLIRRRALSVRSYEVKGEHFGIKPVFPAERQERRRVGHDVIARLGAAAPACSFFQEPSSRTLISGQIIAPSNRRFTKVVGTARVGRGAGQLGQREPDSDGVL
jgi:hypothetical protein